MSNDNLNKTVEVETKRALSTPSTNILNVSTKVKPSKDELEETKGSPITFNHPQQKQLELRACTQSDQPGQKRENANQQELKPQNTLRKSIY